MCMCLHCAHRVKSEDWQIHASLFHRADTLPFNQQACGTCFCLQSLVRDKVNILSDGLQHVISPCNRPVTALPSKTLNFRDWIHRSTLALLWGFDSFSVPYTRGSRFFSSFLFLCPLCTWREANECVIAKRRRKKPKEWNPVYRHPCLWSQKSSLPAALTASNVWATIFCTLEIMISSRAKEEFQK